MPGRGDGQEFGHAQLDDSQAIRSSEWKNVIPHRLIAVAFRRKP
jgi:hypothetical protein